MNLRFPSIAAIFLATALPANALPGTGVTEEQQAEAEAFCNEINATALARRLESRALGDGNVQITIGAGDLKGAVVTFFKNHATMQRKDEAITMPISSADSGPTMIEISGFRCGVARNDFGGTSLSCTTRNPARLFQILYRSDMTPRYASLEISVETQNGDDLNCKGEVPISPYEGRIRFYDGPLDPYYNIDWKKKLNPESP